MHRQSGREKVISRHRLANDPIAHTCTCLHVDFRRCPSKPRPADPRRILRVQPRVSGSAVAAYDLYRISIVYRSLMDLTLQMRPL